MSDVILQKKKIFRQSKAYLILLNILTSVNVIISAKLSVDKIKIKYFFQKNCLILF